MKSSSRVLIGLAVLLAMLAIVVPSTAAQDATGSAGIEMSKTNILVSVRAGKIEGGERITLKSYDLVIADGSPGSKLLSGQRVPFPAATKTSSDESSGDDKAMQQFVYQNIGFAIELRGWVVDKKTVKLMGDLEDSRIREGDDGDPPIVETRQLRINAMLTDGVPLELTRIEVVDDQSGFVEVEARILP